MDLEILKKKLSSFRGDGGRIRNVNDELLLEVLSAWEQWTGPSREFYKSIGSSSKGFASIIGKAKRLKREGHLIPFQEVSLEGITGTNIPVSAVCDIEVQDKDRIIRFRKVDLLLEYLKKAA